MLNDSLKTLSATPPPAHRLWKFKTARTAHAETNRLESLLGLPASPLDFNLTGANYRIRELEALVAHAGAPQTAPTTPATPSAKPEVTGRARFAASIAADAAKKPKAQSHPELRGRERFAAAIRVDRTPQQIVTANDPEKKEKLTGRARFAAAIARDFPTYK